MHRLKEVIKKYQQNIRKVIPVAGLAAVLFAGSSVSGADLYQQNQQMQKESETDLSESSFFANEKLTVRAGAADFYSNQLRKLDVENWQKIYVASSPTMEELQNGVYTFLQGPRAWSEMRPWSGEWALHSVDGNTFGGYGCGLCCMANVYNTLSSYAVSPLDMQALAMHVSNYYPTSESGAIGWEDMKLTLDHTGIKSKLKRKPGSYEEFQKQMKNAQSMIVLISSAESTEYWQNTPGHYVNIYLYDEEADTVFLAEPGSPENNRSRIPLRYIYNALKQVSQYQYLLVTSYVEERNGWKGNGIDDNWIQP